MTISPSLYYLELSNAETGEHKFYEITLSELSFTARYGRIGTQGQSKVYGFDTPEALQKAIAKTLKEKQSKGYSSAQPGQTAKQETTHHAHLRQAREFFTLLAHGRPALVSPCLAGFKAFIEDEDNQQEYEGDAPAMLSAGLREGGEWELLFSVDWKDTESMLSALSSLCDKLEIDLAFDWGTDTPEDDLDVAQIIQRAHAQLAPLGLNLWQWDRGTDSYEGWITRTADTPALTALCAAMGLAVKLPAQA